MSGDPWTVVRVVDLSPSRRRLEYVFGDGSKGHATVDRELDSPDLRRRVAAALLADRHIVKTPRGPVERSPAAPSPWLES